MNWWEEKHCHYCGETRNLIPGGTVHVGGHGEVTIWKCDNEARCFSQRHENVRHGRESWDRGEAVKEKSEVRE